MPVQKKTVAIARSRGDGQDSTARRNARRSPTSRDRGAARGRSSRGTCGGPRLRWWR